MGCGTESIGFARSTDHGRTFGPAQPVLSPSLPGGAVEWDPAIAVAPDGTVYVAYMTKPADPPDGYSTVPAVAASVDHGQTFTRVSTLPPMPSDPSGNWGDRDFITVGPAGTVYVTWDYGPSGDPVSVTGGPGGSDYFTAGEFNAVLQKSSDGGRTWTAPAPINPDYPRGGVFSAPIVPESNGALDVLYWQHPTSPQTLALSPGHEYFTRSTDGGSTWSTPVAVDPGAGKVTLPVWWIDGSIAVDPSNNLYAAWDTQSKHRDTAWLAWSTNGGRRWSRPRVVSSLRRHPGSKTEILVEVAAAGRRSVYAGWQRTGFFASGYATYLRRFSIGRGWTSPAVKVSGALSSPNAWPGDTIGVSAEPNGAGILSWGSARIGGRGLPDIYSASAKLPNRLR